MKTFSCAELAAMDLPLPVHVPDIPSPNKAETPRDHPVKMWSGEVVSVNRAYDILEVWGGRPDPILHRWGDWIITSFGVECLSHPYWITWERMSEEWVDHLCEKNWPVHSDVQNVFAMARMMPEAKRHKR